MENVTLVLTPAQHAALVDCIEAAESDGLHDETIALAREALGLEA